MGPWVSGNRLHADTAPVHAAAGATRRPRTHLVGQTNGGEEEADRRQRVPPADDALALRRQLRLRIARVTARAPRGSNGRVEQPDCVTT